MPGGALNATERERWPPPLRETTHGNHALAEASSKARRTRTRARCSR